MEVQLKQGGLTKKKKKKKELNIYLAKEMPIGRLNT